MIVGNTGEKDTGSARMIDAHRAIVCALYSFVARCFDTSPPVVFPLFFYTSHIASCWVGKRFDWASQLKCFFHTPIGHTLAGQDPLCTSWQDPCGSQYSLLHFSWMLGLSLPRCQVVRYQVGQEFQGHQDRRTAPVPRVEVHTRSYRSLGFRGFQGVPLLGRGV